YKREAFEMFNAMLTRLKHDAVTILARGRIDEQITEEAREERRRQMEAMQFQHDEAASAAEQAAARTADAAVSGQNVPPEVMAQGVEPEMATAGGDVRPETFVRDERKIGRNEPCPCGSGRKYKHCHGRG